MKKCNKLSAMSLSLACVLALSGITSAYGMDPEKTLGYTLDDVIVVHNAENLGNNASKLIQKNSTWIKNIKAFDDFNFEHQNDPLTGTKGLKDFGAEFPRPKDIQAYGPLLQSIERALSQLETTKHPNASKSIEQLSKHQAILQDQLNTLREHMAIERPSGGQGWVDYIGSFVPSWNK